MSKQNPTNKKERTKWEEEGRKEKYKKKRRKEGGRKRERKGRKEIKEKTKHGIFLDRIHLQRISIMKHVI